MKTRNFFPGLISLFLFWNLWINVRPAPAQVVYCQITQVQVQDLLNSVNIDVTANGVLDWEGPGRNRWGEWRTSRIYVQFPEATMGPELQAIYNVEKYPVGTIQVAVPQDARAGGIGVEMIVSLYTPSRVEINQSTDQQHLYINVRKERTIMNGSAATNAGAVAGNKASELTVTFENDLLSVHALKVNIHKLMGEIARVTGVNIAVDDAVQDEVSMALEAMPVDEVFRGIAAGYGLALDQRGGVYMMTEGVPTDLAPYNLSGTESFPMNYLRAREANQLLPPFLFSYALANQEQNTVVVTAPRQMLDKIREDFRKLDVRTPQILVEALAVEFTSTKDAELGLNVLRSSRERDFQMDTALGTLTYRELGPLTHDFQVNLKALVENGRAKIHANPRMAVLNGNEADLFIGRRRFIRVTFLEYGGLQERIIPVDVGVKLKVRPWTGGNNEITTRLEPSITSIVSIDPRTGLPLLSRREASTSVRVRDGETIAIGGLTLQQEFDTKRKIPILGDLPLVGELFRSRSKSKVNSELIIFITPHILTDRGRLPDEEAENRVREQFLENGE